jgi:acyl-CoA dehydrogenase
MLDLTHLSWPFFSDPQRAFAGHLASWAHEAVEPQLIPGNADESCRRLVRALGEAGWLRATVPRAYGGLHDALDVRTLCLAREILAWHDGLADFAFGMQGLGSGSISLLGSDALKARYLPSVCAGRQLPAFALSELEAGSDVGAMSTTAVPDGAAHVRIDGMKTWISNGGIADFYVVFARSGEAPGARGISAFVVEADNPGLSIAARIDVIAPHPLATLRFEGCRVPISHRLGAPGGGFKVAMATLDIFRSTVAAAALGLGRRAQHEALHRAATRQLFGGTLGDLQLTQAALADNAAELDAAALLVYRAGWTKDSGAARISRESAIAKMYATEAAQRVIDRAVQLFGGDGVRVGVKVEALYREIRALRIYEGATEVQKVVIARDLLKSQAAQASSGGTQ